MKRFGKQQAYFYCSIKTACRRRYAGQAVLIWDKRAYVRLLATAKYPQQHQQVDEDVVHIQVYRQRGRNIVGFTAVDHTLEIDQQQYREDTHGHDGDGE